MADAADISQIVSDRFTAEALAKVQAAARAQPRIIGRCISCTAQTPLVFCDSDCEADYNRLQRRNLNG